MSHDFPGPVGLVERDNAQKMLRADLDRETVFGKWGDGVGGISARVSRSYSLQHNTYICENGRRERGPRGWRGGEGRGLSWGKHRVTTGGGNIGVSARSRACVRFHKYFIGSSFDFIAPHDRMTRRIRRQLFSRCAREARIILIYRFRLLALMRRCV